MITEATKVCTKCKALKNVSRFSPDKRHSDKLSSHCKDCNYAYQRKRYEDPAFRESQNERSRVRSRIPEVRAARAVADRAWRYGLSPEEVKRFLEVPVCQACGEPLSDAPNQIHIDHCHETSAVRGVVCMGCNRTMHGPHDHCIARLRACIEYLTRHSERRSVEQT